MEQNTANTQFLNILNAKISELVVKRRSQTPPEQSATNQKLTKLYNLKWQFLQN